MRDVVKQIARLTADPPPKAGAELKKPSVIDLLIVTHEHLDHVSGFSQAQAEFKKYIVFKNIWFAWTENRRDKLAQELRAHYSKAKAALTKVRARMAAANGDAGGANPRVARLDGIMAFSDLDGVAAVGAAGGGDLENGMAYLRAQAKGLGDDAKYLKPGQCLKLPGASPSTVAGQIRAYVLGPPHDRAKITRINPSKKNPEVYEKKKHLKAVAGVSWSWAAAAVQSAASLATPEQTEEFNRSQPFDSQRRIPWQQAADWTSNAGEKFFDDRYFAAGLEREGRRIDDDWLWSGAQKLALHIESYTNNTSLVVAFELPRSNNVLLFAGDAQVGN
jgi:hypothetical protein